MSGETLQAIVRRLAEHDLLVRDLEVSWHAGEPLTLDADFYSAAFEAFNELRSAGIVCRHSIQTNAIPLTLAHVEVLSANDVTVGVSIDGPEEVHNFNRKTRSGKGTYAAAMRGVRLLYEADIPTYAIAVVSNATLAVSPDTFVRSFADAGLTFVGLNFEEIEGRNAASSLSGALGVRDFLREVFRIGLRQNVIFREMIIAGNFILSGRDELQDTTNQLGGIMSFDYSGNFSTFAPELLGFIPSANVRTSSVAEYLEHPSTTRAYAEIATGVTMCQRSCQYYSVCGGGASSNKFFENGTFESTTTQNCIVSKQLVADVVLDMLEHEQDRNAIINTLSTRRYFRSGLYC